MASDVQETGQQQFWYWLCLCIWTEKKICRINSLRPSEALFISKLTIIGSDNGLLPGRRQAIIWTNAGILLIGPLGTNFSEILIKIHTFPFKKMHLQRSRLRRPISKIRRILLMDAETWMMSLIIMFAVRPIYVQDSIFKMSSGSPDLKMLSANGIYFVLALMCQLWC